MFATKRLLLISAFFIVACFAANAIFVYTEGNAIVFDSFDGLLPEEHKMLNERGDLKHELKGKVKTVETVRKYKIYEKISRQKVDYDTDGRVEREYAYEGDSVISVEKFTYKGDTTISRLYNATEEELLCERASVKDKGIVYMFSADTNSLASNIRTVYDDKGNLVEKYINGELVQKRINTYDAKGRLTDVWIDSLNHSVYCYEEGVMTRIDSMDGCMFRTRRYTTDSVPLLLYRHDLLMHKYLGNIVQETEYSIRRNSAKKMVGLSVKIDTLFCDFVFSYDSMNRLSIVKGVDAHGTPVFSGSWTYDEQGRLIEERISNRNAESTKRYTFDPKGRLTEIRCSNKDDIKVNQYLYNDADNTMVEKRGSGGDVRELYRYRFDGCGNVTELSGFDFIENRIYTYYE